MTKRVHAQAQLLFSAFQSGDDGWDDEYVRDNLLTAALLNKGVINILSSGTPASGLTPSVGNVYLCDATEPVYPNAIIVYDGYAGFEAWEAFTPTAVNEGMEVYDQTSNAVYRWGGAAWAPAGSSLPAGGTDGQVLTKQSAADGDADWETPAAGGGTSGFGHPSEIVSAQINVVSAVTTGSVQPVPYALQLAESDLTWDTVAFEFVVPAHLDGAVMAFSAGLNLSNSTSTLWLYLEEDTGGGYTQIVADSNDVGELAVSSGARKVATGYKYRATYFTLTAQNFDTGGRSFFRGHVLSVNANSGAQYTDTILDVAALTFPYNIDIPANVYMVEIFMNKFNDGDADNTAYLEWSEDGGSTYPVSGVWDFTGTSARVIQSTIPLVLNAGIGVTDGRTRLTLNDISVDLVPSFYETMSGHNGGNKISWGKIEGSAGRIDRLRINGVGATPTGGLLIRKHRRPDAAGTQINARTGTAETLALTDSGDIVTMDNAAANVLNIPTNATVAFPRGTIVGGIQKGAGVTTIQAPAGVTLNGVDGGGCAVSAQSGSFSLVQIEIDTWIVSGAVGAVA